MIRSAFAQFGSVVSEGVEEHPVAKQLGLPTRTGTGWVTFDRRHTASEVLDICTENMLVMAGSPSPVTVLPIEPPAAHLLSNTSPVPAPPGTDPVPARFAAAGTLDFELAAEQRELWHRQSVELGLLLSHFRLEKEQLLEAQRGALNEARSAAAQLADGATTLTDMLQRTRRAEAAAAEQQQQLQAMDGARAKRLQAEAFVPSEDEEALRQALYANEYGINADMDGMQLAAQGGGGNSFAAQQWQGGTAAGGVQGGGAFVNGGVALGAGGTYDPRLTMRR